VHCLRDVPYCEALGGDACAARAASSYGLQHSLQICLAIGRTLRKSTVPAEWHRSDLQAQSMSTMSNSTARHASTHICSSQRHKTSFHCGCTWGCDGWRRARRKALLWCSGRFEEELVQLLFCFCSRERGDGVKSSWQVQQRRGSASTYRRHLQVCWTVVCLMRHVASCFSWSSRSSRHTYRPWPH
jgi:hypothetical protein